MRFLHLRAIVKYDQDGNKIYARTGGTTVGYVKMPDGKFLVTFARCSELDEFNKAKARQICLGRFAKGVKMKEMEIPDGTNRMETLVAAAKLNDKETQEKYGHRQRKGA